MIDPLVFIQYRTSIFPTTGSDPSVFRRETILCPVTGRSDEPGTVLGHYPVNTTCTGDEEWGNPFLVGRQRIGGIFHLKVESQVQNRMIETL